MQAGVPSPERCRSATLLTGSPTPDGAGQRANPLGNERERTSAPLVLALPRESRSAAGGPPYRRPERCRVPARDQAARGSHSAVEMHRPWPRDLQPAPLPNRGVSLKVSVLNGDLKNLSKPRESLVDRLGQQPRPSHLVVPLPVHLSDRDLGQPVLERRTATGGSKAHSRRRQPSSAAARASWEPTTRTRTHVAGARAVTAAPRGVRASSPPDPGIEYGGPSGAIDVRGRRWLILMSHP